MKDVTLSTIEEYERWRLEYKMISDLVARCEEADRKLLASLGCPSDLAAIESILSQRDGVRPPWPKKTAARDKIRARHALHSLAQLAKVKIYVALGQENSRLAAQAALLAGMLTNGAAIDGALGLKTRTRARAGGKARGEAIARTASAQDSEIKKYARRWKLSEELQDDYRSMAAYIQDKTAIRRRTIERRLKALKLVVKSRQ